MVGRLRFHRVLSILTIVLLAPSAFAVAAVPSRTASSSPATGTPAATGTATTTATATTATATTATATTATATTVTTTTGTSSFAELVMMSDDFTHDTALNTQTWEINGPVGSVFGPDDVGSSCELYPVEPTFSSTGMEIAEITSNCETVTIQSVASFEPPFTATAVVEGTISNGHTFVFAIASAGADSGVAIIGNLNPDNCSNLGNCGDPSTCGNAANNNIAAGNCFYGIDVKSGTGGGHWSTAPKLYLTPSVNVFYTVQISVNSSGTARYSISQGGQVLGTAASTVGVGPFYVVMEQAEGQPDSGDGPNEAYWQSVSLTPVLQVYPTESSYGEFTLDYPGSVSSPIHVTVVQGQNYPNGLTVTLRQRGTSNFQNAIDVQPSSSGSSTIQVNATLNCTVGKCMKSGGTQLPLNYDITITASSGSYTQNTAIELDLMKAQWLVMLYDASDSVLQGYELYNVQEMVSASGPNNNPAVGILVLFYCFSGPTTLGSNPPQSAGTIALYKVANGTVTQVGGVWQQTNIFDPATLSKFLSVAMGMVPADRNQLILNDHGGGITGFGYNAQNTMSVPGLASALSGLSTKLDILSFDACLMAQVEVLYQLSSYASYFTASERNVPGPGYAYTGFITSLLQNPDQSTVAYLEVIVSTYAAKYASYDDVIPTLAAINSSQLAGVVSGLNTLSGVLIQDYGVLNKQQVLSSVPLVSQFNVSMRQMIDFYVVFAHPDFPYFDVRSLAQNLIKLFTQNQQYMTGSAFTQGILAANDLITDVKAAVIANTTTNKMYEGLTVLLFKPLFTATGDYQYYAGLESQLSFSSAANWLPLLYDVFRSEGGPSVTAITLTHAGHQLYLNAYNSTGGRTGYNPALLNVSRTAIEVIPDSYYLDFGNGTTLISLPSSVQNFTVVVDGTSMEEASEAYNLTYTVIQNGTVTSTKTVRGTIDQNTLQSAVVSIQGGVLNIGATTITTSTASTTSPAISTTSSTAASITSSTAVTTSSPPSITSSPPSITSSAASTSPSTASATSSSSTSTGSSTSLTASYALAEIFVIVFIVVAAVVLPRGRAAESAPEIR